MIEGSTQIGGVSFRVQDEQLMLYFPDGEGTSEPLTQNVIDRLKFILDVAEQHLHQAVNAHIAEQERIFEIVPPARSGLRAFIRANVGI